MLKYCILSILVSKVVSGAHLKCNSFDKLPTLSHWEKKFKIKVGTKRNVNKAVHKSKQAFDDAPLGLYETMTESDKVHAYYEYISLYKSPDVLLPRKTSYLILLYAKYGDSVTVHKFYPSTKEYTKTSLGMFPGQFFMIIEPKIKQGQHISFFYAGLTIIRGNADVGTFQLADRKEMLADFPLHKHVIDTLYANE